MTEETWIEFGGESGDTEETLQGSRNGLQALRDAINAALETGEAVIDIPKSSLLRVAVLETRPQHVPSETTIKETLWLAGCGTVGGLLLFLLILGLKTFVGWFLP